MCNGPWRRSRTGACKLIYRSPSSLSSPLGSPAPRPAQFQQRGVWQVLLFFKKAICCVGLISLTDSERGAKLAKMAICRWRYSLPLLLRQGRLLHGEHRPGPQRAAPDQPVGAPDSSRPPLPLLEHQGAPRYQGGHAPLLGRHRCHFWQRWTRRTKPLPSRVDRVGVSEGLEGGWGCHTTPVGAACRWCVVSSSSSVHGQLTCALGVRCFHPFIESWLSLVNEIARSPRLWEEH